MSQKMIDSAYHFVLAVLLVVVTILVTRAASNDDMVEEMKGLRVDFKELAKTMNKGLTRSQIADAIHDVEIKALQDKNQ